MLAQTITTANVSKHLDKKTNGDFKKFNPDFPLGKEKTTKDSLMDFLRKFEGNRLFYWPKHFQTIGAEKNAKWTSWRSR